MRKILAGAWAIGLFGIAGVALAQEATEAQMDAAFKDLSSVYGAPIVRIDQAKAICNEEKYVVDCAEIGKKHNLFSDARTKQVDTLLTEFKGEVVEKMKRCEDSACLIDVAASIAGRLNSGNPSVARAMELTPQKVKEKKTIVDTAKSLGVDMEACRTMDPDTASIELLRGCARLAKHENVQKYIPQATRDRAEGADAAIALKESLASGQISCGDNTLEGCGNFCLAPPSEAREKGASAIPEVCRQIASKFFGNEGVKELENAYSTVQKTFDTFTDNAKNIAFVTADGRTLSDPGSIGRYMEDAGSRGDVEAVSRGMDFLVKKGFVTEKDRDFAISMVKKVKERGPVNFGECRTDPSKCADLIPEEDKGQFTAMGEIDRIMRTEMEKRGVSDPSLCSSDPSVGQSCMEAARAALPQIELLAKDSPQAQNIVSDIRQKIRFGEAGMEARSRVEERFKTSGDFSMGENRFSSIAELEAFCRTNSQQCLSETAREGIFSRDVAEERYERSMEIRYNAVPPEDMQGTRLAPDGFNKEEALQQFKQWLDNPTGPPPMPPNMDPRQYQQYPQYPAAPYSPYQRPPIDQGRCQYAQVMPVPCKAGEYRQESVNEFGCSVFGSCIPFETKTEPPRPDGRNICPALPTVESCSAGEEKTIAFSSPECGTYYSCRAAYKPPVDDPNRTTSSCERYGSGWRPMDSSGNCFSPSATEYRTLSGALNSCASAPVYGCSSSDVPPSIVPPYPAPTGQREQVWNSSGLRSWVRADADQARIESLKQACANVPSSANIWLPNAGTQSSPDFGMPDPAKCARAAACSSGQYFDGSNCTTSNQSTSCPSGQYWNGASCTTSGGTGSMYKCTYPHAYFTTDYKEFTAFCERDYVNCKRVDTNASIGTAGLSLGAPSSCESGWTNGSTSCPSGQYWNGSACISSTTQTDYTAAQQGCAGAGGTWDNSSNYCRMPNQTTTTGSCSSDMIGLLGSGCHSMGNGWFNTDMTQYVLSSGTTVKSCATEYVSGCSGGTYTQTQTSCPSGQYWNGSSCVQTSTTDCTSGQYWNGSACVSSTQTQTSCGSGQYWNGSACVTSTTQTSQTSTSCGSGQYWNGSSCVATSPTDTVPTDTSSWQQNCASAGGTWDSSSNYCRMPSTSTYPSSGTYSSGSTYTAPSSGSTYTPPPTETTQTYTPPPTTESSPPPTTTTTTESAPISYLFCPEGHDWNGAYCTLSPRSPFERYTANVWSAFRSLFSF